MKYYKRKIKKYDAGDMIFSENSDCDGMYIIDKGKVRVFKTIISGGKPTDVELCVLGPKAMFGEMAMIDESKRSASIQAIVPTECTVITKQIFEDQLNNIPPWMVNMIKILVSRLRETNEKLKAVVQENTEMIINDESDILIKNEDENYVGGIVKINKTSSEEIIKSLFTEEKG